MFVDKKITQVSYLTEDTVYSVTNGTVADDAQHNSWNVNVLRDDSWPLPGEMMMDDVQLAALRSAITKQITIIQGPPGKYHILNVC